MSTHCDVAVIGGGPAGASTAIYLREHGYHTVVLEKLRFPRFHIGESLLPANLGLFDELGIHEEVKTRGYPTKFGAEFVSQCGDHVRKFYFREALLPSGPTAYQVLRSDFDHILLNRARAVGADVREDSAVTDVSPVDDRLLTVFSPESRYYAQTEAPASVGDALDFALEELEIDAPMSDFFKGNVAEGMMTGVHTALYLGLSRIRGVECHQLALRHSEFDVQIWVSTGSNPLPQKVVIASIFEGGSPRFSSLLDWNVSPTFTGETFDFTAPEGSIKIDFLR